MIARRYILIKVYVYMVCFSGIVKVYLTTEEKASYQHNYICSCILVQRIGAPPSNHFTPPTELAEQIGFRISVLSPPIFGIFTNNRKKFGKMEWSFPCLLLISEEFGWIPILGMLLPNFGVRFHPKIGFESIVETGHTLYSFRFYH